MRKLLLFSLFCMAYSIPISGQTTTTSSGKIDVIGTATEVLKPDMIIIEINVSNEAATPKEAQQLTSETVTKALAYLKSKPGIKSIETNYVILRSTRNDYNRKDASRYVSTQSIAFVLRDMGDYQTVIIDLLNQGVNGIGSVRFDSSQRKQYEEQLMAKAIENARAKAVFMSAQLNQEVGKALYIADRISSGPSPVSYKSMEMTEAATIAPRELKISAMVNITFELK